MNGKLNKNIGFVLIFLMALMLAFPAGSWGATSTAGTLRIRVSATADDAEQSGGTVTVGVDDLHLGQGDAVGIRFQGLAIPQGSAITKAYILFTADELSSGATDLTFYTEKHDDAPAFADVNIDVTARPHSNASVAWTNVAAWGSASEDGVIHQTPDLSEIVEEVVQRSGWVSGYAIVFIVEGSGNRIARAYNGDPDSAPMLHVEYAAGAIDVPIADPDDDAQETMAGSINLVGNHLDFDTGHMVGLRFQDVNVPAGAEITRAYISLAADAVKTDATSISIYVDDHDDATAFTNGIRNISDRTLSGDYMRWTGVVPWMTVHNFYQTPDLSELVQQIVSRSGWAANNNMAFIFETSHGEREAETFNDDSDFAAVLHIEYAQDNVPIISTDKPNLGASCYEAEDATAGNLTISNAGVGTLDFALSDDADWLTLSSTSGSLTIGQSHSVSVTYDTDALAIGTYSARITITAAGAANSPTEVFVSLTVLENQASIGCSNIPVYAQELVSPAIMVLLDISGSMKSLANVVNNPVLPSTPDLSAIVKEIVDRADWNSGNALFFILEGSGQRAVWNWFQTDGVNSSWLNVTYNAGSGDQIIRLRTLSEAGDGMETISSGAIDARSLMYLGTNVDSDAVLTGLRFYDVLIPQGADIIEADIEFYAAEVDTNPASITIWGEDIGSADTIDKRNDFNLSNRPRTGNSVVWDIAPWDDNVITWKKKIVIAQEVIKQIVDEEKGAAWGFGSWHSRGSIDVDGVDVPYEAANDYTIIQESCALWTVDHRNDIFAGVDVLTASGNTPFMESINAGRDYFRSIRPDLNGDIFVGETCQPRFLINITDGVGDPPSDEVTVGNAVVDLAGEEVTPVAIGYELEGLDTSQIYAFADKANQAGNADPNDDVYAIHAEVGGVPQPFFTNSQVDFLNALRSILNGVKGAIYHGAAPAPTTSADLGDTVIVAKYDAANWLGDVERVQKDSNGQWVSKVWSANEQMPADRNLWTIEPGTDSNVVEYNAATLTGDNFDCLDPGNMNGVVAEPLGDIINSRPIVVDHPPYWYPFDGYSNFGLDTSRDPMIYIGANDGALHAIQLTDGLERWAFFPKSMHAKLELADSDPLFDRCSTGYCHQYYVDGSPVVADVYAKFGDVDKDWRTILVVGEREGGEAYFALDITYGKAFDDADAAQKTKFLWEFTDGELGQTWGDPSIERVAVDGQDQKNDDPNDSPSEWAVFFGSGYTSDPGNMSTKEAYVYGIVADDGSALWKEADGLTPTNRIKLVESVTQVVYKDLVGIFVVGEVLSQTSPSANGTIVAIDTGTKTLALENVTGTFETGAQIEGANGAMAEVAGGLTNNALSPVLAADLLAPPLLSYYADYLYVGDLYGNMYRVTNIGKDMHPEVSTLFTFNHTADEVNYNPIRGKAAYGYDFTLEDIWVYFGTGIYEQQVYKGDNNQQYFFGLKDGVVPAPTYELDDLVTLQAKFSTETIDSQTMTFRYIDGDNLDTKSWKMQLFAKQPDWGWPDPDPTGSERVITQPLVVGEVVFFTTFIPDSDVCAGSGETWLLALNFNTGTAATDAVFDINGDGAFDENDMIDTNGDGTKDVFPVGILIGRGLGSQPVLHKDTLFVTVSGEGDKFFAEKVNVPQSKVRVRSWWQN